ncbi:MAG: DUF928 domain-containing protein [Deltaproteobacteria bacterium]|nr:DUF928 domain-containing protein [Deltaproteobacteria bacterium]
MMRVNRVDILIVITGLFAFLISPVFEGNGSFLNAAEKKTFSYKPPMRGKPGNRVGGGTRGTQDDMPVIAALVPDHTGLTTLGQPVLYWYLSKATKNNIEFTLNDDKGVQPVAEMALKDTDRPGIHAIRLSDYKIDLLKGTEYQWFVSVVRDTEQRSRDIIATGMIRRVEPAKDLTEKLSSAGKTERPFVYAENGIWYDALSALSQLIEENPDDKTLIEQRALLLRQIGMAEFSDVPKK